MAHVTLNTTGMHCGSCAMLIRMNVGDIEGVESVSVDLASATTEVEYDPAVLDVQRIVDEIVASGYGAEPVA